MEEFLAFFRANALGGVLLRGLIWIVAVLIFAAGLDNGKDYVHIKSSAGWFFFFLFGTGILSYLIFGFTPTF